MLKQVTEILYSMEINTNLINGLLLLLVEKMFCVVEKIL